MKKNNAQPRKLRRKERGLKPKRKLFTPRVYNSAYGQMAIRAKYGSGWFS